MVPVCGIDAFYFTVFNIQFKEWHISKTKKDAFVQLDTSRTCHVALASLQSARGVENAWQNQSAIAVQRLVWTLLHEQWLGGARRCRMISLY